MNFFYLRGYKWLLSQNQRVRNAFLVIDGTRHWLSISNLFSKNLKVKGSQCFGYNKLKKKT